jgi:hypothetical protein
MSWGGDLGVGISVHRLRRRYHHVNLGFYYGAGLPDPEGLLEGSGKELRHIKIHTLEQVKQPAVRKLVEEASRHLPRLKP